MPAISVFLITRNEGAYLDQVLGSVEGADEIVLVDSGSTDDTVEIARRHGARVLHRDWPGYAEQKAFAMDQCTHDWVLNLDGDEVLPPGGLARIRERIARGDVNGLRLPHDDLFFGHSLRGHRHHRFLRVYRRSKVKWETWRKVHEKVEIEPPVGRLDVVVRHHGYDTAHGYMEKLNDYSRLKALQREERGREFSQLRLVFIFPAMFLKFWLGRRMILSGFRGFTKAMIDAFHFFLTEAKLHERHHRRRRGEEIAPGEERPPLSPPKTDA
ncbi:MAG: glycosyltransferase family 2 protein [Gemmatimonadales bacterium]|nr:MAG: glycosyltransferase family 2 protein [Gemmatimonadales bacterium]